MDRMDDKRPTIPAPASYAETIERYRQICQQPREECESTEDMSPVDAIREAAEAE